MDVDSASSSLDLNLNLSLFDRACEEALSLIMVSVEALDAVSISYSKYEVVVITIVLPIMLIVGLINNIAFIQVVIRVKCMKTITNACLVNLAIADIIFLTIGIGEKNLAYIHSPISRDDSHVGLFGCIFIRFSMNTTYFVSLITVTLITFERFYAVCSPQKAMHGFVASKTIRWLLVGSWIMSGLLSATFIQAISKISTICALWPDQEPYNSWPKMFQWCQPVERWMLTYKQIVQAIPFFIAFFINVFLSCRIVKGLNKAVERAKILGKRDRNIRSRNQVAKMLIVNSLVFFLCLAPFEIISIIKGLGNLDSTKLRNLLDLFIAQMLEYVNSLINPVIYIGMSTKYRKAFIKGLLQPRFRKK